MRSLYARSWLLSQFVRIIVVPIRYAALAATNVLAVTLIAENERRHLNFLQPLADIRTTRQFGAFGGDMGTLQSMILCSILVLLSGTCLAQKARIPFKQIERDAKVAQLSSSVEVPGNEAEVNHLSGLDPALSSSSGIVLARPTMKPPRTLSSGF